MKVQDQLLIREQENVLEVTFNRPEKYNAISDGMLDGLRVAIDTFATRRELRVLLLRAVGKYFTAGVELNPDISPDVESTLDGRAWYRRKFHSLFDEFEAVEKPIVAAHQGPCLGGGLELSLSCDFRLAAKSARYSLPEIDIGALPGSGGVSRLTRIAGPHWARWLVMAGETVDSACRLSAPNSPDNHMKCWDWPSSPSNWPWIWTAPSHATSSGSAIASCSPARSIRLWSRLSWSARPRSARPAARAER